VLFAVCVNGPLWTDFQINGMEWNGHQQTRAVSFCTERQWPSVPLCTKQQWPENRALWYLARSVDDTRRRHSISDHILFIKYDVNHVRQLPSMPKPCCKCAKSRPWSTVSNAAVKSNRQCRHLPLVSRH